MVIGGFGQDDSKIGSPFTAGASTYDFNKSELFYSSRPLYVFRRLVRLARITSAFNIKLLLDWKLGNIEKYENERAAEALTLVTQLGPTFIKLGQALSIRTDLIPKAYALELRTLQDAVPPFDSVEAKKIIQEELGVTSFSQVFSKISEKPVSYNDGIIRSFFNRFLLLYVDRKC
jgi:predicted unusual protein kinase regulating ubiquinone biosynthesis (AarF/ABC1/UbiB family)